MRSAGLVVLFAGMALVGCEGAVGSAEDESPRADAAPDTSWLFDDDVAPDIAAPDAPAEAAVDTAPEATVVDASPHVCPTSATTLDCSPGTGTGEGDQCADAPSCYVSIVQKAINGIVSAHPDWFDFTGPGGCPVIKDVDTFLDTVVADIAAQGLCVKRDPNAPGEEITLKKNNAFTENFDIVSSAGCARSGSAIYTGFCAPAWW